MASGLQQMLRRLCSGTEWKYAFFWKLKHQSHMVLALEDAYYDTNRMSDSSELVCSTESMHDPLLLALAKMSYYVYSLGEGIVGQVAITGKHHWIFCDDYDFSSRLSDNVRYQDCDLWKAQFRAGIKTAVVVAILPYGVLQLGSLQKLDVDLTLLAYFRDAFHSIQDTLVQHQFASCHIDDLALPSPEENIRGVSLAIPESSSILQKDLILEKLDADDRLNVPDELRFSTISELHEALGPVFQMKTEARPVEIFEPISGNHLSNESCEEHLLEAIVAKVSQSTSKPMEYQEGYSMVHHADRENSAVKVNFSGSNFYTSSSATSCPSSGVELLDGSVNAVKSGKKRARPGENHRPRPRDRQQIQDRLKELRELVPNGSKCSIDSLLENTVKHLLFLESVTKNADNLKRCTNSKFRPYREPIKSGPVHYDPDSSWAVEVGSQMKVHSIAVENLSKNGQLLVEMLCENGDIFLEIAEAMRSLGLTILKGATEPQCGKIWICFVVEGEDVSRMDILWSVVQVLQLKTSSET